MAAYRSLWRKFLACEGLGGEHRYWLCCNSFDSSDEILGVVNEASAAVTSKGVLDSNSSAPCSSCLDGRTEKLPMELNESTDRSE